MDLLNPLSLYFLFLSAFILPLLLFSQISFFLNKLLNWLHNATSVSPFFFLIRTFNVMSLTLRIVLSWLYNYYQLLMKSASLDSFTYWLTFRHRISSAFSIPDFSHILSSLILKQPCEFS